jgi:transposase
MNAQTDKREFLRELILSGLHTRAASEAAGTSYIAARKVYEELSRAGQVSFYTGRPSKLTQDQQDQVFDMLEAGKTRAQIAKHFEVSATTICTLAKRMRDGGRPIPKRKILAPVFMFYRVGLELGKMSSAFDGLTSDQIMMIVKEIPAGCTVADWLRGVVRDVVDEMEDGK